jgi:hypothetical protein
MPRVLVVLQNISEMFQVVINNVQSATTATNLFRNPLALTQMPDLAILKRKSELWNLKF